LARELGHNPAASGAGVAWDFLRRTSSKKDASSRAFRVMASGLDCCFRQSAPKRFIFA